MSEKFLIFWVVCENSGKVLFVYCDCMVGFGESCFYVVSLLWVIEAGCKRRDSLIVTDKKVYWVLLILVKIVLYVRVKDINFLKILCLILIVKFFSVIFFLEIELINFFNCIKDCFFKFVLLFFVFVYLDFYVFKFVNFELLVVLFSLFDNSFVDVDYFILLKKLEEVIELFKVIKK